MTGTKIFYDPKYETMKLWDGGKARKIETLPGKAQADSNHDPDHFEIWEQKGKYYLFCFEVGPAYYGIEIPAEKLEEIRAISDPKQLQGIACNALYV